MLTFNKYEQEAEYGKNTNDRAPKKQKISPSVACVYCNGGTRCETLFELEQDIFDCIKAIELYPEGNKACKYGCIGLGTCIKKCPVKAISLNEYGVARVDRSLCINCGICIKICPKNLIRRHDRLQSIQPLCSNKDSGKEAVKVCKVSCIACKRCENNCPADAIKVIDNVAVIDDVKCLSCGMCVTVCPRKLIKDLDGVVLP